MQENKGKYLLVIEGAIPVKDNGIYCKIAGETMPGLTHEVAEHATAIVADAVNTGDPLGTVVRIINDEIFVFFQTKLSNHQLALSDLLALLALKDEVSKHMAIIGMAPNFQDNRLGLTPVSAAGLDQMVEMLVPELNGLGIHLHDVHR